MEPVYLYQSHLPYSIQFLFLFGILPFVAQQIWKTPGWRMVLSAVDAENKFKFLFLTQLHTMHWDLWQSGDTKGETQVYLFLLYVIM